MKIAKGVTASVIIILISGLAFATGFLKERVVTEIEDVKASIAEKETLVEKMDERTSDMILQDQMEILEAKNHFAMAKSKAVELDVTWGFVGPLQQELMYRDIQFNLNYYEILVRYCNVGKIYMHFALSNDDYFICNESKDGYNFTITQEKYDYYTGQFHLGSTYGGLQFLTEKGFPRADQIYNNITLSPGDLRTDLGTLEFWSLLLRNESYELQAEIDTLETSLIQQESIVSYYSYGITLITVITILATALAAQINDKERERDFSHVKAEIYDNKEMIIKRTSNWPMFLLLAAFLLAILGLVLPMFF